MDIPTRKSKGSKTYIVYASAVIGFYMRYTTAYFRSGS